VAIANQKRAFVKFLMRHWHSLARKIWLEDAKRNGTDCAKYPIESSKSKKTFDYQINTLENIG